MSISTPSTSDPEEALRLAELVRRAALAPASPSSQDHAVAASATQKAASARADMIKAANEAASAERAEKAEEKAVKAEKTGKPDSASGSNGKKDNTSVPGQKNGITDFSGINVARGKKAANAYASISDISKPPASSSNIRAVG